MSTRDRIAADAVDLSWTEARGDAWRTSWRRDEIEIHCRWTRWGGLMSAVLLDAEGEERITEAPRVHALLEQHGHRRTREEQSTPQPATVEERLLAYADELERVDGYTRLDGIDPADVAARLRVIAGGES